MHRGAIAFLVASSLVFYCVWDITLSWVIIASICINYFLSLLLWRPDLSQKFKSIILFTGVAINLSAIGYFKYRNFGIDLFHNAFGDGGGASSLTELVLPLGISFFTFQQIAFLVDVRNGAVKKSSFLDYSLFVLFFPQLIAGPIVHHKEMMPQFEKGGRVTRLDISVGLTLFTIGLFKKIILADEFAVYANPLFAAVDAGYEVSFLEAWLGSISYTFQLYFDISGYADMALGLARLFGIKLPLNFDSPYKSKSIIEFWQRWHMTLTRFLQSYVYNPVALAATRWHLRRAKHVKSPFGKEVLTFVVQLSFPLMVTMTLAGIWHGAGFQFVVFGALHGSYLVINHFWRRISHRLHVRNAVLSFGLKMLSVAVTFACVVVAFVPFRASSLSSAMEIGRGLFGFDRLKLLESQVNGTLAPAVGTLKSLGVEFSGRFEFLYWGGDQIMLIAAGLVIVMLLPNSQQIVGRFMELSDLQKTKDENREIPASRFAKIKETIFLWQPNIVWGTFIAGLWIYSVLDISGTAEFIYFQF